MICPTGARIVLRRCRPVSRAYSGQAFLTEQGPLVVSIALASNGRGVFSGACTHLVRLQGGLYFQIQPRKGRKAECNIRLDGSLLCGRLTCATRGGQCPLWSCLTCDSSKPCPTRLSLSRPRAKLSWPTTRRKRCSVTSPAS